jgi:hypothetical protein
VVEEATAAETETEGEVMTLDAAHILLVDSLETLDEMRRLLFVAAAAASAQALPAIVGLDAEWQPERASTFGPKPANPVSILQVCTRTVEQGSHHSWHYTRVITDPS